MEMKDTRSGFGAGLTELGQTNENVVALCADLTGSLKMGDLKAKFEAFGWLVFEEERGNDMESILNVLNAAKSETKKGKPIVILLYTEMGNGVDYMMGTHKWHGSAPNDEQLEIALSQNEETLGDY